MANECLLIFQLLKMTLMSKCLDIIFLVITALIARHGITYRKEDGERDFVRLLFGCIAATYFFLVLFKDVLGLISF